MSLSARKPSLNRTIEALEDPGCRSDIVLESFVRYAKDQVDGDYARELESLLDNGRYDQARNMAENLREDYGVAL